MEASGHAQATIGEEGFAVLDRAKLNLISTKTYSDDPAAREEEDKNDLAAACLTKDRRPTVETSLHNALAASYVVHLHPTLVNALMCSRDAEAKTAELFGEEALYIPYIDPGYILFKEVERRIGEYKARTGGREPEVILLQNHGIFVGAETPERVRAVYDRVLETIGKAVENPLPEGADAEDDPAERERRALEVLPAVRMMLSEEGALKVLKVRHNALIAHFLAEPERLAGIGRPFTPDIIVYCKSGYLFPKAEACTVPDALAQELKAFREKYGYGPKVLLMPGIGLVAAGDHAAQCEIILDVYEDMMKIAWLARSFGGEHPMTQRQIDFIDNWEVENYRRKVSAGGRSGRLENKNVVITGAAQGFGEGIARCLVREGANIVVADLNESAGMRTAESLNAMAGKNRAVFVRTDVSDTASLDGLMRAAAMEFGGIDVFISNAGVLRAGGLDAMTPENFDFVTRINYNAYFYCAKAVAPVMKLQNQYAPWNYGDIVQINSKSGLRGSKANFAYAGGKFGGIGLTQSFALELAPYRIKVNSVCPGNFYEGPLWSDPENGLFVQYLKAGKVPGAKTVGDVRAYYMAQVPVGRGCRPEGGTRAVLYLVEQTCETGQALPVTGGQVMLS